MISRFKTSKIGVIGGGRSRERDVSLRSATGAFQALTRLGYDAVMLDPSADVIRGACDVAFIALHGEGGEDGAIQGLCETLRIPYTGSGILASATAIHKLRTKQLLAQAGLPVPNFIDLDQLDGDHPVVLKPCKEGSSIGVEIISDIATLTARYEAAVQMYGDCMIEPFITGQEITVSVIQIDRVLTALPILELKSQNTFYDYDAKYTPGKTQFILPANLSEGATKTCQDLAIAAFNQLGCKGFGRVDMIVDAGGQPYILEINTIPGLTQTSDLPAQAQQVGIGYDQLIKLMLDSV